MVKNEKWQDLVVFRRTTNVYELFFTTDSIPEDITDWTIYFTMKLQQKDPETSAIIVKDITAHTDAEHGKTEIELTPDDTDIDTRPYYYDIVVKDDEGNINVIANGRIHVKEHPTSRA